MEQHPPKIDFLAWWTSIPGIPAGWPEPQRSRAPVIAIPAVQASAPAPAQEELPVRAAA